MRYFLIAGEASGDLHASHLMQALQREDPEATFAYYGGDLMQAVGGTLLRHYRDLAYMGFIQVALHLRTILRGMKDCRKAIDRWRPDAVILVDYPGFNLSIARYVRRESLCPVYYYISPKIWAWKEGRIRAIRRDVTRLFSILPFEVKFFEEKHHYPISYVGNPTVDEVSAWRTSHPDVAREERLLALLPGSRRQEITHNLGRMLAAIAPLLQAGWRAEIAVAPSTNRSLFDRIIEGGDVPAERVKLIEGNTFDLLARAQASLVTSGTATLETALLGTPQVVCYHMAFPRLVRAVRPYFLKVPFISLVNLIADREVVPELVAADMTPTRVRSELEAILPGTPGREAQLAGYADMARRLGDPGAPERAAHEMVSRLRGATPEPS